MVVVKEWGGTADIGEGIRGGGEMGVEGEFMYVVRDIGWEWVDVIG